jgi:hypothetical protein
VHRNSKRAGGLAGLAAASVLVAAALAATAPTADGADDILLRYKFRPGERVTYLTTTEERVEAVMGTLSKNETTTTRETIVVEVRGAAAGGAGDLSFTFPETVVTGEGKFSDERRTRADALRHVEIRTRVDARGKTLTFEVLGATPEAGTEDSLREKVRLEALPGDRARPGSTWADETHLALFPGVTVRVTLGYELAKIHDLLGHTNAVVNMTAKLEATDLPPELAGTMAIDGDSTGRGLFDVGEGRYSSLEAKQRLHVTAGKDAAAMSLDVTAAVKMTTAKVDRR